MELMKPSAPATDDRRADAVPRFKVTDARKKALKSAGAKSRRVSPAK
jgi:hypothetical protein